ncbi:Cut9-interacting protein Scn1 [Malassezia pachydermatis]
MSTDTEDQALVARIADRYPDKVVPCFGFHPWTVHTISLHDPPPSAYEHYTELFGDAVPEKETLYAAWPTPISLAAALRQLEAYLSKYPHALVGEVGVDRSFRLPWPHTHPRQLTKLQTPLAHQMVILEAQVAVACRLRRSVSMHSVRSVGPTLEFLERARTWPSFATTPLVLHSCTMSAQSIQQVQRTHPNVYISFSTAVNGRQRHWKEQIQACDVSRLLCESDRSEWSVLADETRAVVETMQSALQMPSLEALADQLTNNFLAFACMNSSSDLTT